MTIKIILFVLYLIFIFFDAFKDAYLYHYQSGKLPSHWLFTTHRFIFGGLVAWISKDWLYCVSLILMFPLLFDGAYYEIRHRLNPDAYIQGWASEASDSSTALIDIPFFWRLSLAMIGVVLFVADLFIF